MKRRVKALIIDRMIIYCPVQPSLMCAPGHMTVKTCAKTEGINLPLQQQFCQKTTSSLLPSCSKQLISHTRFPCQTLWFLPAPHASL